MHVREVEAVSFLMFGINGVWKAFFEKLTVQITEKPFGKIPGN